MKKKTLVIVIIVVLVIFFGISALACVGYLLWKAANDSGNENNTMIDEPINFHMGLNDNVNIENTNSDKSSNKNSSKDENENTSSNETIYTNPDYGFTLTFPMDWKGVKVQPSYVSSADYVDSYEVLLQTTDQEFIDTYGDQYFAMCLVDIMTQQQWDDAQESPFIGEELGRDDRYVYVGTHFNGMPPIDLEVQTRQLEDVMDSFTVK